jgi:hypothetical protein
MAEENWLDGLCHYDGPGSDLPLGGYSKVPNWAPEDIVKRVQVLDAETDEGFVWKKKSELKASDILIGVEQNANAIKAMVNSYGRDFYKVRDANGGPLMTLDQWQEKYGSNALGLVAMRNLRAKASGQKPPIQDVSAANVMPKKPSVPAYKIG